MTTTTKPTIDHHATFGHRGRVHAMAWDRRGMQALCGADRMTMELPRETDEDVTCKRCLRAMETEREER